MPSLSRRSFLMAATASGVGVALDGAFASTPSSTSSAAPRVTRVDDGSLFPQSVGGDPTWTGRTKGRHPPRVPALRAWRIRCR